VREALYYLFVVIVWSAFVIAAIYIRAGQQYAYPVNIYVPPVTQPVAPPVPSVTPQPTPAEAWIVKTTPLLSAVNDYRLARRLRPLRLNECLHGQATAHAQYMASRHWLTHSGFGNRLSRCDIRSGAENVAMGPTDAAAVVQMWHNSPGHRANMLSDHIEAGAAGKDGYWCLILGTP
jgi:uncharacterized protein YkwD